MSYIAAITIAVPKYKHAQADNALFYSNTTTDENIKRKIKIVSNKSGIDTRYSVLPDYSKTNVNDFLFYPKNTALTPAPTLTQRMAVYKTEALQLALTAVHKIENFNNYKHNITHIITVTCTGLFAPGLDIELIQALNLKPTTQRSSINFMGCNAAILALNNANSICNSTPNANVLVVCVELCTLHFQTEYTDDYIVSNTLFSDGCAATLVCTQPPALPYIQGLQLEEFNSLIISAGKNEMAWQLSERGFIMNLTSYVSALINGEMQTLMNTLNINPTSIAYWAIHPGGKKIIDDFVTVLGLTPTHLQASYNVLREYGNMSSPTVLFVLKHIIENNTIAKNEIIFTAAFGPGLSIETLQLRYV
ncbi:MAG: type III polyketide synthase [Bacteroidia bacterium]|nr:type III polyketide synthase [Bacteroidia bacterium]